jgi:hypothetical protein
VLTAAVVQRVADRCPSARIVLAATQPAAVLATTPSVIVVPLVREPARNGLVTGVSQLVRYTLGLIVTVTHAADAATGAPAIDALEIVLDEIEAALLGWAPDADWAPLELARGQIDAAEPGRLTWRDEWMTERLARSAELG